MSELEKVWPVSEKSKTKKSEWLHLSASFTSTDAASLQTGATKPTNLGQFPLQQAPPQEV